MSKMVRSVELNAEEKARQLARAPRIPVGDVGDVWECKQCKTIWIMQPPIPRVVGVGYSSRGRQWIRAGWWNQRKYGTRPIKEWTTDDTTSA